MDQQKQISISFLLIGIIGISGAISGLIQSHEISELKKHPTYHCDGSATMGYAVPGTPEAAACWIEGGRK